MKHVLHGELPKLPICHELSKDFLGVSERDLKAQWKVGTNLDHIRFILADKKGNNRVEQTNGQKICDLRVPPGPSSGLHFSGGQSVNVALDNLVTFGFDSSTAYHTLGSGVCQLRPAVGNYRLVTSTRP